MEKCLTLSLNKYPLVPNSLRESSKINEPAPSVYVGLASLYHHYYLDSYGLRPPNPDPVQFEHAQFLLPTPDFRFQGRGLGVSTAIKGHRSNELGQAFCRWFLHDHLNITYFAHMGDVLNRQLHRAFSGCRLVRSAAGDSPDYFCAESVTRVFLAEAKGRYTSISFGSQEFKQWRQQFNRVTFLDSSGHPRKIKGHIVATRFATEKDSQRVKSGIWAEDPESPGERPLDAESGTELAKAILGIHYKSVAEKLGQPVLAAALATAVSIPSELLIVAVVWQVTVGPLQGRRFVGGYFGPQNYKAIAHDEQGHFFYPKPDPLRLDRPNATFFGVEEMIFRQVVNFARGGQQSDGEIQTFDQLTFFYSGFSVLRDGTALGPLDFFMPVEQITI